MGSEESGETGHRDSARAESKPQVAGGPRPASAATHETMRAVPASGATIALGLGRPFLEELASRGLLPQWMVEEAMRSDPEDRCSLRAGLRMLDDAIAISGDPDLGLHAALRQSLQPQLLEYTAVSCQTCRAAWETTARYIMVLNEGLDVEVRVEGDRALIALHDREAMNRPAIDFSVASLYLLHLRWGGAVARSRTSVWFKYGKPADTRAHEKVFGMHRVRFDAPCHALCFPAEWLGEPLSSADRALHAVLVRSVNDRLAELPVRQGLAQKVRALMRETPPDRAFHAQLVADRLGMSPRTLTRRLEAEGTSFRALLDEARCAETLRCLLGDGLSVRETAKRVGFADATSFYKAFRRWFGMTPGQYLEDRAKR